MKIRFSPFSDQTICGCDEYLGHDRASHLDRIDRKESCRHGNFRPERSSKIGRFVAILATLKTFGDKFFFGYFLGHHCECIKDLKLILVAILATLKHFWRQIFLWLLFGPPLRLHQGPQADFSCHFGDFKTLLATNLALTTFWAPLQLLQGPQADFVMHSFIGSIVSLSDPSMKNMLISGPFKEADCGMLLMLSKTPGCFANSLVNKKVFL